MFFQKLCKKGVAMRKKISGNQEKDDLHQSRTMRFPSFSASLCLDFDRKIGIPDPIFYQTS
jgi:hypothetical protein